MSKRAGEFHIEQYTNRCSKKPKLDKNANLELIPVLKLGDDWYVHRTSLEDYFNAECIYDDIKKISVFIASLKNEYYQTMRDLCKPDLPYHKTFEQLCQIMEKHYLKSLILKIRREFSWLKQFNSETVTQWFSRVQEAAAQCNFGEQLDDKVKNQFVNGMEEGQILECVLNAGCETTLKNIIEIALKKEEELRPIEKLPEELAIQILSYLPIVDRIRIERVNKSWQEMAKKSWNNLKELNGKSLFLELKAILAILNIRTFEAFLSRSGRYLEKIDLGFLNFPICVIPLIANNCPNIQSLICNKVSVTGLKKLSENCRNITEISIKEFEEKDVLDQVLGDLFTSNRKFQALDIPDYVGNGDCLLKLPFEEIISIKIPSLRQWEPSEQKIINLIEKSKNLSIFKYETVDANVLSTLASNCRNLTELDLKLNGDFRIDDMDNRLSQIFKNNENLKSIKLVNFKTMTGECLLTLDENIIEKIVLNRVRNIQRNFLIQSLPNFTKLHTLKSVKVGHTAFVHVAECISLCSKLKKLSIVEKKVPKDLNLFASSKNIEWLGITLMKDQAIAESFLKYMGYNLLELKHLDITGYDNAALDCKFDLICKLPKLEVLDISRQSKITGSGLENFPNLKELYCKGCEDLEDENLISLLKCASSLQILNVRDCKKITNSIIYTAIDETRKRTNNIVLEIFTDGTKIRPNIISSKIQEMTALLRLA